MRYDRVRAGVQTSVARFVPGVYPLEVEVRTAGLDVERSDHAPRTFRASSAALSAVKANGPAVTWYSPESGSSPADIGPP